MKILVTGGSGLIGRFCLAQLAARGHEVHAISTIARDAEGVSWHQANLLDPFQIKQVLHDLKPTHLLHLAWETRHGQYWTSQSNLDWMQASIGLAEEFARYGGKRLVVAGTCAEYQWSNVPRTSFNESFPTIPASLYGQCKNSLQQTLTAWAPSASVSMAWGRIFSLYGPGEDPRRLVASIISALLQNRPATCNQANLIRDYCHAADVASAFVSLIENDLEGPINVGSGQAHNLGEIVNTIGRKLDAMHLIELNETIAILSKDPVALLPNISRLIEGGWRPKFTLNTGLDDAIAWWRKHLDQTPTPLSSILP
jgi:nucleoside-diphosphate-sugar epimerase